MRVPANRYVVFGLIAVIGCALDLGTKHVMFSWPQLQRGEVYWLVPEIAGFELSLNRGAMFGMGQGGHFWFALASVVAGVAIPVWLFGYRAAHDWWMTATLGAIMGGVLGNLYDRAGLHGMVWGAGWHAPEGLGGQPIYAVRDWILVQANNAWRWPNFNIADSLLVVGAAALFFHAWRQPAKGASAQPAAPETHA